ncbi:helix-turn-helix domain-containing protein [Patescibacteria group bacterium]|nr:helix-turn-helix domain-containing protein [Patescibacteria group bacterium]MBU1016005.1 helix-turn-helix domain-containing protein [Patescibacteria group bacterium]MBU1684630.1 helix-turn-helix domain-containing protein [Patescibacteria group bacterium]MBU1939070.1 helix-turn-helix domain-containing protein [Patescibacteria group bacterium]
MVNLSTTYVDRDEASSILKVSTRTVDRYIRKFRFKTRKDGRRVLIKRIDVDKIIEEHIGQFVDIKSTILDKREEHTKAAPQATGFEVKDIKVESFRKSEKEEEVYKGLYHETKNELKEKQERLDAATYRVGQLEAQVKTMVPMLDYTRKEKELKEAKSAIEQKELEKLQEIRHMEHKLKTERIAKWIYLSLVGLLLVAEPVLFLFWAFS